MPVKRNRSGTRVLADPSGPADRIQRALRQASQAPLYRTGADFAKALGADYAIKGDVLKRVAIKAQ